MQFKIITLFPDLFPGCLGASVLGRAKKLGLWSLEVVDLKRFGRGASRRVDDRPYGGGPGMIMRANVVGPALEFCKSGSWADAKVFF